MLTIESQRRRMTLPRAIFLRLIGILFVAMLSLVPATAQQSGQTQPAGGLQRAIEFGPAATATSNSEVIDAQRLIIQGIARDAEVMERRIRASPEDDTVLVEARLGLDELARKLIESGVAFRPRLAAINDRLAQIGPAPAEGEPAEPDALREERQTLLTEKAEINTLLGEAEALSLRVNRLIDEVAQMRRDLFTNTLSRRYDISAALSPAVLQDFAVETSKLSQAVSSWVRFVINFKLQSVLMATFFAVLAAAVLLIGWRRLFGNLIIANPEIESPSLLNRLSVAFWSTLLPSATLAVFLFATYFFYTYYGVLRVDISQMMVTLFNVIAIVYFVYRLTRAIFKPWNPSWRLVPIETPAARMLFWLAWLTALVTGIDFFASKVNDVMGSPLSLTVAKSLFATLIVGALVLAFAFVRPYRGYDGRPRGWHPLFRALLFALGGGTILAALLGYIGLARFISQQIVVTGAILATMYIGYLSASAISDIGAFTRTALGRRLDNYFDLDEATEDQLGLVASVVINLLVLCLGIPLILLQWGFQWGDISTWVYNVATEVRIGSISISLIGILTGIGVFVVGYFGTRAFQRWLDGKVMSRGKVDAGVRNSIGTAVGYAGIALAALVGISAAGIDLSNLALVAGALSLGIGFGLQNIVNNFVSGLILLAERPFKAGDWIVAGGVSGTVKKISVRATEIETFQRQTVILPNSELINAAVGNWTHRNKVGRVEIPIGVAYGSDPRRIHQMLVDIAASHPVVLKNPEPMVLFVGFGDSSLNFEVRFFLADITSQIAVSNEIRFQIVERLAEAGIEIPFPQRDLTIKGLPPIEFAPPPTAPEKAKSAVKGVASRKGPATGGTQ
jgi:potassium efflux system protein